MITPHLRHALRSLSRASGLAAVSILTIALGVGAATTLFSVVKAVLLNPLPYPDPGRLVWVASRANGEEIRTSVPDFDDWRQQTHSFSSMAFYSEAPVIAAGGDAPQHVSGAIVSDEFFDVMGVPPARGRTLAADDHRPGAILASVVISHGLWQRAFGGVPDIVGRRVTLLGVPSTVIGVMPPGFAFPGSSDLWVSARALPDGGSRTAHNFWVVGRLAPGVTLDVAREDLSAVARELHRQYSGPYQSEDATVEPLATHLARSARTPLLILLGAVGLLLFIVCINVANLLLVRVMSRSHELAVRTALGAERRHLIRHLMAESLLLATSGGALGLLLAYWSMDLLRVLLPSTLPRASDARIDAGVAAFAIGVTAMTGILFGMLPALRASRPDLSTILKTGSRGLTAGRKAQRMQGALVVSEVALSVVLLAGAGLLLDSFTRLRAVNPGFSASGVLAANLSFPMSDGEVERLAGRYRELLDRVRAFPGVEAAGTIKDLPLDPVQRGGNFFIENRSRDQAFEAGYLVATPGMMEALGIPILRGRGLTGADSASTPAVAVVNAEMARRFWPGRDPIGERIWFDSFEPDERWLTIVGIAGDVRQRGLTDPVPPVAYINYEQAQVPAQLGSGTLVVRSPLAPETLIPAVRAALRTVHPGAAVTFRTMDEVMADATSRQRFQMQVLAAFAALAIALAAVGLYGVLSYAVTRVRAAIGIRMALGAGPKRIAGMVAAHAIGLTIAGVVAGLLACVALREVLRPVLYETGPGDPRVLSLAVIAMLAAALAAAWFPARRAMRVEPMAALREE